MWASGGNLKMRALCLALGLVFVFFVNDVARAAEPVGDETFEGGFACLAPSNASDHGPVTCQSVINPSLPSFTFTLTWHSNATAATQVLDRIDVTRKGETAPFQTIAPVDSNLPPSVANHGFEMIDLNFDGFLDMRVMRFLPAGPNMPYENWLWSPADGKFVANAGLDEITSPQFDADDEEITSDWRSSASEHGSDTYTYDGVKPVLIHREADAVAPNGTCLRTFYDRIEDALKKTGTGPCDDPAQ